MVNQSVEKKNTEKLSAVEKAESEIREMIQAGAWSHLQPIPTDKELAARLKVSRGTIVKSLRLLQEKGLIVGYQGKGRFVNSMIERSRTGIVAALISDLSDLGHVVVTDRLAGIQAALAETNYHVRILAVNEKGSRRSLRQIVDPGSIEGIALFTQFLDLAEVEELAKETRVLWVDAPASLPGVTTISLDFLGATFAAARHLLSLGHRHLALVTGSESVYPVLRRQRDGLRLAMTDLIESGNGMLHCLGAEDFTEAEGRRLGRVLLGLNPRPTAVLCGSDELSVGVYKEMVSAGLKIPADMSMISWSDTAVAHDIPLQLTTISVDYRDLGQRAMSELLHMIEGINPQRVAEEVTPRLVIRQSTVAPSTK